MKRTKLKDRLLPNYSTGEEIMNMTTHIVGAATGFVALVLCLIVASISRDRYAIAGSLIFGLSMISLYTMSSIYHGLSSKLMAKKIFQILDHCMIFVLIAGTYTPILLTRIREANPLMGWSMFIAIWSIAILGIVLNSIDLKKYKTFSIICYLAMGWFAVFTGPAIFNILGLVTCLWLMAGGIAYTIGAALYIIGKQMKKDMYILYSISL